MHCNKPSMMAGMYSLVIICFLGNSLIATSSDQQIKKEYLANCYIGWNFVMATAMSYCAYKLCSSRNDADHYRDINDADSDSTASFSDDGSNLWYRELP